MSKKKKRNKKRRIRSNRLYNNHHILWMKNSWNRPWAKRLREHEYLVVNIPINSQHRVVHEKIKCIPVLREDVCQSAYKELDNMWSNGEIAGDDPVSYRINILLSIIEGYNSATTSALKKERQVFAEFEWNDFFSKLP